MAFDKLVLSGGSIYAAGFLGCIRFLEEKKILKGIKNIISVSAGSMVGFFLALGFTSHEMQEFLKLHLDSTINNIPVDCLFQVFDGMGIISGDMLTEFLSKAIQLKFQCSDITFIDLAKKSGINLVVTVSNLTKEHPEFWGIDTHPDMSVCFAVKTSCSIPILFQPVLYKNNMYVDGSLFCNFPAGYFTKDRVLKDTLGIRIGCTKVCAIPTNIIEYTKYLITKMMLRINTMTENSSFEKTTEVKADNVVSLLFDDEPDIQFDLHTLKFNITPEIINNYIAHGYNSIKTSWTAFSVSQSS